MFLVKYLFSILYTRLEEVNRKKKSDLARQVLANVPTARARKTLVSEAFRVLTSAGLMSLSFHDGASTLPRVTDGMRYEGIDQNAGLEETEFRL